MSKYGKSYEDYMILAMELVIAADCEVDQHEMEGVEAMAKLLPRLREVDIHKKLNEAVKFIISEGFEAALEHFKGVTNDDLKKTCLILALETAMVNDDVAEEEEDVVAHLAHVMDVDDDTLNQIVDIVSWKYA